MVEGQVKNKDLSEFVINQMKEDSNAIFSML